MPGIFITSSGTEIGKTFVACALLQHFAEQGVKARALKPVISGMRDVSLTQSDSGRLLAASGKTPTKELVEAISPWQFAAPLAPAVAARAEGKSVPFHDVVEFCSEELEAHPQALTLIEAAGGIMAPLTETHTMRDWWRALRLPTILVVGNYLGSLSHTLTALEAMKDPALPIAVIVSDQRQGAMRLEDTAAELQKFTSANVKLFTLPYSAQGEQADASALANWVKQHAS